MVQIPPEKLKAALVEQGLVNARQFDEALEEATRMNQDVADVLVARGIVNYDYRYKLFASGVNLNSLSRESRNAQCSATGARRRPHAPELAACLQPLSALPAGKRKRESDWRRQSKNRCQ